ncbi:M48 family metalloprotease [Gammaproteobacteria bacterium]|nr:M48 family metalloprotease [Gammaproteobacteria bacterium]
MHRLFLILILLLPSPAALPQSNFDELPNLGDASGQVISPKQDKELGAYFMRQIRQAGMVLDDPESTAYLQALGHKLAIHSENPGYGFTFFLVNDTSINAFAGPGGYIGANVGLFLAAESESELAGVMAHEIAHVTQRHLARAFQAQERMSLPTTAAIIAAIIIGAAADPSAGAAAMTAASAAGIQSQINFTRANEKEADRVGIQTLADANFDPFGMPQFFERLQKNSKLYGTRPPEFLSTHPVTSNRISEATSRAETFPRVKNYTSLDFFLLQAKLRVNNYPNPRQVLADTRRYEGKSGGKTPVEQYEFALLLAKNENYNEALPIMQSLHKKDPDRIAYRLALGQMLNDANQKQEALDLYKNTLDLYPGEIMVIQPYATTLMAAGKSDKAFKLLSDISNTNDPEPQIYKLLAQAAGATNHKLQTHTAMSQYYFLNGYTNQAIEQLKLAEKSPSLSAYETARIQARIANLESILKAERQE